MMNYCSMKLSTGLILALILSLSSCGEQQTPASALDKMDSIAEVISPEIQQIIDSANVNGVVLIYDVQNQKYYSNDFLRAGKGFLPASTFKIPNSIIALETGVAEDENTLFKWNGEKRRLQVWEQDLKFRDAFHLSCVPCYQQIARKVGPETMNAYLTKLNYGTMQVDSSSIDVFWLEGSSKISAFGQVDFLFRFYNSQLPVAEKTITIMKRMMVIDENDNYKISGKTGWAIRGTIDLGWFVGYLETGGHTYFFATNIDPRPGFDMNTFYQKRTEITMNAMRALKII